MIALPPKAETPETERPLVTAFVQAYARMRAYVVRRVGCAAAADDIMQDAYLRIAQRPDAGIAAPEPYAYRVVGNLALDWQRRQKSAASGAMPIDLVPCSAPSIETRREDRDRLRRVLDLADRLPAKCREVFVLRKLEGLEQAEIATKLGISLNMVQKHLRKALADIQAGLEEDR